MLNDKITSNFLSAFFWGIFIYKFMREGWIRTKSRKAKAVSKLLLLAVPEQTEYCCWGQSWCSWWWEYWRPVSHPARASLPDSRFAYLNETLELATIYGTAYRTIITEQSTVAEMWRNRGRLASDEKISGDTEAVTDAFFRQHTVRLFLHLQGLVTVLSWTETML